MSRRKPRQSKTDKDLIARLVEAEVARRLNVKALPPGAAAKPISDALLMQMQAAQAPAKQGEPLFSPGAPLRPIPGMSPQGMPRAYAFPVGYNIGSLPRVEADTSFDTLRNLASLYDGIALCEQVWLDIVSKLTLVIKPRPELVQDGNDNDKAFASDIARYTDFFSYPDPAQDLDLKGWLRMAVRDQLQIDAVAIYIRRNRAGGLYGLELVDGSTIKPLIDPRGRRPTPPYPAYQQFPYGAPGDLLTSDDMLYIKETPRTDSVYGLSRVERIILRVNQALRKQNRDLANFTDGTTPAGLLAPPNDGSQWTPEQLLAYQEVWDGLLAGNDQARARIKVIEPGATWTKTATDDIMVDFDRFLLNITTAAFSMTMADLGFTESVNKSSGDSQENVFYRRAVQPLADRYAALFTFILRKYFNEQRFLVTFGGFEESEDFVALSTAYINLVKAGIISPPFAAQQLKFPASATANVPPYYGAANGPIFMEDAANPELRQAQLQAQINGAKQAQNLAPNKGKGDEEEPGSALDNDATEGATKNSAASSTKTQQPAKNKDVDDEHASEGDEERLMESSPPFSDGLRTWRPPGEAQLSLEAKLAETLKKLLKKAQITKHGVAPLPSEDIEEATAQIEALLEQAVALGHSIANSENRGLVSGIKNLASRATQIVSGVLSTLADKVQDFLDNLDPDDFEGDDEDEAMDDLEAEFEDWVGGYADMVGLTEVSAAIEETAFDDYIEQGVLQIVWVASPGACKRCMDNAAAGAIPIGSTFPSGDAIPPGHPNCRCQLSTA